MNLTAQTFLAAMEMIQQHLRIKEADRWGPQVCKLKFHSFRSEFPEVTETQFFWACEQWIQATQPKEFNVVPTWTTLMSALYRTENGQANRSWGPKENLPKFCRFTPEQIALLPRTPTSILPAPDSRNAAAYRLVGAAATAQRLAPVDMKGALPPSKERLLAAMTG